jgi:hypothetical protein
LQGNEIENRLKQKTFEIAGYKIKEDWFYNSSWQLSETRIIGICPVIKDKNGEMIDLFWIYYPELRPIIVTEKVETNVNSLIKNLDDVFYFRDFSSTIYKESNVYDRKIADYKTRNGIKEEADKIEMSILDLEHDIWIKSTSEN